MQIISELFEWDLIFGWISLSFFFFSLFNQTDLSRDYKANCSAIAILHSQTNVSFIFHLNEIHIETQPIRIQKC